MEGMYSQKNTMQDMDTFRETDYDDNDIVDYDDDGDDGEDELDLGSEEEESIVE